MINTPTELVDTHTEAKPSQGSGMQLAFWFLISQVVVCLFVFWGGIWGKSILAPIDIAPAFFPQYRYLDPSSTGIPENHWVIDQLTYDLPEQLTNYKAINSGEIPWWDPYTWGGRLLLTDAALSGSDLLRWLLYLILPFENAYNWVRILHFVLSGLGMLLLLRRFRFANWVCVLLAVAFEFSGNFTMHFGHPWIQASFLYYPFIWLVWDLAFTEDKRWCCAAAPLLIAAVFYAGSLQSHAYMVFLALAFALGYGGFNFNAWKRIVGLLAFSGLAGACLAAPVLLPQIELYLIGEHKSNTIFNALCLLQGLASFAAAYPWSLGTYRTLDASKLFAKQVIPLGFILYIGSAAFLLALVGAVSRKQHLEQGAARRTALWLCAFYFLVASTPLVKFLYLRCATLGSMGLIILAAFGIKEALGRKNLPHGLGRAFILGTVFIALATNVVALAVYPKLIPRAMRFVEEERSGRLDGVAAFRRFQVRNWPAEVSFQNPETVFAAIGMVAVGVLLMRSQWRSREGLWCAVLVLNLVPVLLFANRFVPKHPMSQYRELLAGGPNQQKLVQLLRNTPKRLLEESPSELQRAFPWAMSHLYEVRTVHGYSSLRPYSLFMLTAEERQKLTPHLADVVYRSDNNGNGVIITNVVSGLARFRWLEASSRSISVKADGLRRIQLSFDPGPAATLIWSDTFYPGWRGWIDSKEVALTLAPPTMTRIEVPAAARELTLEFQPRFINAAWCLVGVAAFGTLLAGLMPRRWLRGAEVG